MPLQIRRAANATERLGTTAQPFMPLVGEQILQLDNDIMYMGDGTTRGGVATTFAPYSAAGTYAQGDVVLVAAGDSTTIYRYVSPHLKSAGAFNASEVDTDNNAIWSSVAGGGGGGLTVRHLGLTTMNVLADELITDNERLWLMMENQTNRSLTAPPTDNTSLLLSGGDVLPILSDPTASGDYVRRVGTAPVAYPTDDIPTTFSPTVGATRSPTIHRENATTFAIQFNQTTANQPSAANLLTYFPMGSTFYIPAANLRDFQGQTLSPAPYAIRGTVNGAPTVVPGGEGYVVRVPVTGVNDEFLADNTSHTFYFNAIQVLPQQSWIASDGHDGSFTTDVSITKTVPKLTFNETNTDATTTADIDFQIGGSTVSRIVGATNGTAGNLDFQMNNASGTLTPMLTLQGFQDTVDIRRPVTFEQAATANGALSVTGLTTLSGGLNVTGTVNLPQDSINASEMAENSVAERSLAVTGTAGTVGQVLSLANTSTGEFRWIDDAQGDENIIYRTHTMASSTLPSTQSVQNFANNVGSANVVQTFATNDGHGNIRTEGFNRWTRTGDNLTTTSYEERVNTGVSNFAIQGPTSGTFTMVPVIQDSADGLGSWEDVTLKAPAPSAVTVDYGVDQSRVFADLVYDTNVGRPWRRLVWRLGSLEEVVAKTFYGPHSPLIVTDTANTYSNTDLVLLADPTPQHDYLWRNTAANEFTAVEAKTPAVLSVDTSSSTLTLDNNGRLSAEVAPIGDADGTLTDLTGPAVVALTHYNYSFNVSTNLTLEDSTSLDANNVRYANNNGTTVADTSTLGTNNAITPSSDANNPTEVDIQTFLTTTSAPNAARTYSIAVWGSNGNLPSGLLTTSQEINGGARDLTQIAALGFQRLVLHYENDTNWFVGRLVSFAVGPASPTGQINSFRYHIVAGMGTVPNTGTAIHVGSSTTGSAANVTQINSIAGLTYGPGTQLVPAPLFSGNIHGGGQTLQGLGVSAAPQNITDANLVGNAKLGSNNSFTGTNSFDSTTSFNAASTFSLPVTAAGAPTENAHLTNKAYVDGLVTGLPDAPTAPTAPAVEVAPTGEWRLRYRAPGLMYAPTTALGGASIAPTYSGVDGGQIASIGDWQLQTGEFRTNTGLSGGTLTVGNTYVLRVHRGTNPGNGIVTHLGGLPTFNSPAAPGAYLNESNYGYLAFIGSPDRHFVFKINRRGFDNFDDSNVYYEMVLQFGAGAWLANGTTNNMLFNTTATNIPGITNFTTAAAFDWVLVS